MHIRIEQISSHLNFRAEEQYTTMNPTCRNQTVGTAIDLEALPPPSFCTFGPDPCSGSRTRALAPGLPPRGREKHKPARRA